MSTARNLALQALRSLDSTLQFADWENGDGEDIGPQLREAVAALEAELAQPAETVAWCGVSKSTLPIYRGDE